MFFRDSRDKGPVTDLAAIEWHIAVHAIFMASAKIVNHDHSFAYIAQSLYRYAANVPGPSCH
jgi:hypothetical protein